MREKAEEHEAGVCEAGQKEVWPDILKGQEEVGLGSERELALAVVWVESRPASPVGAAQQRHEREKARNIPCAAQRTHSMGGRRNCRPKSFPTTAPARAGTYSGIASRATTTNCAPASWSPCSFEGCVTSATSAAATSRATTTPVAAAPDSNTPFQGSWGFIITPATVPATAGARPAARTTHAKSDISSQYRVLASCFIRPFWGRGTPISTGRPVREIAGLLDPTPGQVAGAGCITVKEAPWRSIRQA